MSNQEAQSQITGLHRGRRTSSPHRISVLFLAIVALCAAVATAEITDNCEPPADGCQDIINCPLVQPPTIFANGGVLDTELKVKLRSNVCVPVATQSGGEVATMTWREMDLRNYHSPVTPDGDTMGPTLRLRKATLEDPTQPPGDDNPVIAGKEGTRLLINLKNRFPNATMSAEECRIAQYWVCSENPTVQCSCSDPDSTSCSEESDFNCGIEGDDKCNQVTIDQVTPNCFHGPEVTNLHYHGTHVSPQPHQDYVLLKLFSSRQTDPPPPCGPGTDTPECPVNIAVGDYQTDINPFPWNQAPGTHWYHPHKHGSTALQLINGMAGALLIAGALDDYLFERYDVDPTSEDSLNQFEKVLIVQQIWDNVLFFQNGIPTGYPPYPLVNGQLVPTITMKYGETQRWRWISATTNASTQLALTITGNISGDSADLEVKQIEQDGVQFAPENYGSQPLGDTTDGLEMSPGNRVDLLVKAPDSASESGATMTFYVMREVIGAVSKDLKKKIELQNALVKKALGLTGAKISTPSATSAFAGPLVKIVVGPDSVTDPVALPTQAEWPDMPYFLQDLSTQGNGPRTVVFSMSTNTTGDSTQGLPSTKFYIDGMQYSSTCAGETVTRGDTEKWTVMNTSVPSHPFHIHINPFQLLSRKWKDVSGDTTQAHKQVFSPPYPWFDTIGLKAGTLLDPSVTKVRQQFEDYTGAYVHHCHFLGHEDRGMMTNVQTVCEPSDTVDNSPIIFGTPDASGGADDCDTAVTDTSPLVDCPGIEEGTSE